VTETKEMNNDSSSFSNRIVCITGMHRSGTSLFASWMEKLGVQLDFGDLIPAAFWNKKGHYEDRRIVKFQGAALKKRYPRSRGWKVYNPEFLSFTNEEKLFVTEMLKERSSIPCWGWKDPRTLFFASEWLNMDPNMVVLAVYRPAVEVVSSLVERSKKSRELTPDASSLLHIGILNAVRIWKTHNQIALNLKKQHPQRVQLISIHDLIAKNEEHFHKLQPILPDSLNYEPIGSLYQEGMLSKDATILGPGVRLAIHLLTLNLTNQLRSNSLLEG